MIDISTAFGKRARQRLENEAVCWLTTVTTAGQPKSIPIWFLWQDDETMLFYSQPNTLKLRNIGNNPRVSVNLNADEYGNDIIRLEGKAEVPVDFPPATGVPAFIAKYAEKLAHMNMTPESFAADYSVPIVLKPERLRGWV